jgi:bifunctional DNA-binding transcriptional regulator/antitoxin component of YhaV-PrlF toxin-antitoxin module
MPIARLKEKRQITVPAEICRQIHADTGDMFDFEVDGNRVVMRLQRLVPAAENTTHSKGVDASQHKASTNESSGSVDQTGKGMTPQAKKAQEALAFIEKLEAIPNKPPSLDEEDYYKRYL